jgi:excisionase family DNA binding protein
MSEIKYTSGQAAKFLGISKDTLRRLEKNGKIHSVRSPKNNYRYYPESVLENYGRSLDLIKLASKWAKSKKSYEPLAFYYCPYSSFFQSQLSRLESALIKMDVLKEIFPLLVAMAGEIGNNSFDHNLGNWPDVPGIFFSFDVNKKIIVLADRGRGVLTTLKTVKPNLKNDKEALLVAFTEIISGRAPESRGNGLKFVKDVVYNNKAISLFFKSGNAELMIDKNRKELKISESKESIRGCLAIIKF